MSDQRSVGRTIFVLSRGARACLLLGLLLLVLGVYALVTPIDIQSPQGPMVACGSGWRPPGDQFHKNVCGRLAQRQQVQAGFLVGGALVVAAGGVLIFGSSRREERAATAFEDGESPPLRD